MNTAAKGAVLLRVSFFRKIGGIPLGSRLTRGAPFKDWAMYTKLFLYGGSLAIYPLPLYKYQMKSAHSVFYTATDKEKILGFWRICELHCLSLDEEEFTVCTLKHFLYRHGYFKSSSFNSADMFFDSLSKMLPMCAEEEEYKNFPLCSLVFSSNIRNNVQSHLLDRNASYWPFERTNL
jgi:hypothetical protein